MSTLDEELAALEAEDQATEEEIEAARAEQVKRDRIAFLKLKKEHGAHKVRVINVGPACYKPGWPTQLVVSTMDGAAKNRVEQMLGSNSPAKKAQGLRCAVADSLLYPEAKVFAEMCATFQHLEGSTAIAALELSKAQIEAEGKG
jgi:hypothetical protein